MGHKPSHGGGGGGGQPPPSSPDPEPEVQVDSNIKSVGTSQSDARRSSDRFSFIKMPSSKLPPDAEAIVNVIANAISGGITRQDLIRAMDDGSGSRQAIVRRLSHYQTRLVRAKIIRIDRQS